MPASAWGWWQQQQQSVIQKWALVRPATLLDHHHHHHHACQRMRVMAAAAAVCHPEMGTGKASHLAGLAGMPKRAPSGHRDSDREEKGCHYLPIVGGIASIGPGGWLRGQQSSYREELAVGRRTALEPSRRCHRPAGHLWKHCQRGEDSYYRTTVMKWTKSFGWEATSDLLYTGRGTGGHHQAGTQWQNAVHWSAPWPSNNNACKKSWAWPGRRAVPSIGSVTWRLWGWSLPVAIVPVRRPATTAKIRTKIVPGACRGSGRHPPSKGTWPFTSRRSRRRL